MRIVLLKGLHFPFVALILGYERWRLHLDQRRHAKAPLQGRNSPKETDRPRSGRWMPKPLTATGTRRQLLAHRRREPTAQAQSETLDALANAVANLKSQADTISSMIAAEKRKETAPA